MDWKTSCRIPRGADAAIVESLLKGLTVGGVNAGGAEMALAAAVAALPRLVAGTGVAGLDALGYPLEHGVVVEVAGSINMTYVQTLPLDSLTITLTQLIDDEFRVPNGT
jgi:hypothetical protein